MKIVHTVKELRSALDALRQGGRTVGLVPTMGALHEGHASLVRRSVVENDVTVVSVFVNPTQFNDPNDLRLYPRNLEADCHLLAGVGADVVFAPTPEDVYPEPDTRQFSYAPLDTVMEGAHRPGHFNGVCQVVSRLFAFAQPTRAYFGEKDYQQLAIVRAMVCDLGFPLDIVACPIVREADGLALSSRNARLTAEQRVQAVAISRALRDSLAYARTHTVAQTRDHVVADIAAAPGLRLEYYEIVDGDTLQTIERWTDARRVAVGCITVWCGDVRLIDNIKYEPLTDANAL